MAKINIIIPVYLGLEELKKCLSSVQQYSQQNDCEIVIIDDDSPDKAIKFWLESLQDNPDGLHLIRNTKNAGFAASVNNGMRLHQDRDVVLLNSDTIVSNNWVDRLCRIAYSRADIGTVTPFSNNATICSFPKNCQDNALSEDLSLEELDKIFATVNSEAFVEIPTAVGFCMYIKRACIDAVGYFDDKNFGAGYGEECDFCMRAKAKGWKHVLAADTFVYHAGSVSFGSGKNPLHNNAQKKLDMLYPSYHRLVREHITENPAQTYRINATMHLMRASKKQNILYVLHNMGGGTEKHICDIVEHLSAEINPFTLMPSNNGLKMTLRFGVTPQSDSLCFSIPEEYEELLKACKHLKIARVHFNHIIGINSAIWKIGKDLGVPADITLHDYYYINSNPTLADENGKFQKDLIHGNDLPHQGSLPAGDSGLPDLDARAMHELLGSVDRIFAPSAFTCEIYKRKYPDLQPIIAYHPDWEKDYPYPPVQLNSVSADQPLKILVLGALSREKGADILESCAVLAQIRKIQLDFQLLGYAYRPLSKEVHQHGPYRDEDLQTLISNLSPHLIWFPAQWPETYSYTLSAALRSGLPIVAPNFGSFPERLQMRPFTWIETWDSSPSQWLDLFASIRDQLIATCHKQRLFSWPEQPIPSGFKYQTDYCTAPNPPAANSDSGGNSEYELDIEWIRRFEGAKISARAGNLALSRRERLLRLLLYLRQNIIISWLLRLVPFEIQRRIKRRLSSRPAHELLIR